MGNLTCPLSYCVGMPLGCVERFSWLLGSGENQWRNKLLQKSTKPSRMPSAPPQFPKPLFMHPNPEPSNKSKTLNARGLKHPKADGKKQYLFNFHVTFHVHFQLVLHYWIRSLKPQSINPKPSIVVSIFLSILYRLHPTP